MLERAIAAIAAVAGTVIVAGAPVPEALDAPVDGEEIRIIEDAEPFAGPLHGLAGALRSTSTELAIVVGGDMPGLVSAVLHAMLDRLASDDDIEAALLANPPEPVVATFAEAPRQQVLPLALRVGPASAAADEALRAGDRSLVKLVARLRYAEIPASTWLALDPGGRTLLDVDRPEDVARIRRELR